MPCAPTTVDPLGRQAVLVTYIEVWKAYMDGYPVAVELDALMRLRNWGEIWVFVREDEDPLVAALADLKVSYRDAPPYEKLLTHHEAGNA